MLTSEAQRPRWSVMLPTYNRADFLETALRSVLAQDPGPEQMQIEVVDNSSTGAVRQVVSQLGSQRVALHYVPEHLSITTAMNLCVARARGQWVHILHDDDFTHPGFYAAAAGAFEQHPHLGAVVTRNEAVDAAGQRFGLSLLLRETPGVPAGLLETIAVVNHIQYVSIVVPRQVYAAVGPFDERLLYTADWDMWKRIAARYPVWYEPEPLACYRAHPGSDTSRLMRTAGNAADMRAAIALSAEYLPPAQAARLVQQARRYHARTALNCGLRYLLRRDLPAARAQLREGWTTYPSVKHTLRVVLGGARRGWRSS